MGCTSNDSHKPGTSETSYEPSHVLKKVELVRLNIFTGTLRFYLVLLVCFTRILNIIINKTVMKQSFTVSVVSAEQQHWPSRDETMWVLIGEIRLFEVSGDDADEPAEFPPPLLVRLGFRFGVGVGVGVGLSEQSAVSRQLSQRRAHVLVERLLDQREQREQPVHARTRVAGVVEPAQMQLEQFADERLIQTEHHSDQWRRPAMLRQQTATGHCRSVQLFAEFPETERFPGVLVAPLRKVHLRQLLRSLQLFAKFHQSNSKVGKIGQLKICKLHLQSVDGTVRPDEYLSILPVLRRRQSIRSARLRVLIVADEHSLSLAEFRPIAPRHHHVCMALTIQNNLKQASIRNRQMRVATHLQFICHTLLLNSMFEKQTRQVEAETELPITVNELIGSRLLVALIAARGSY